ncbi:uncharacterized protein LOC130140412 [Syzygium oleosum]|uniref:uncharacterized protein LOC130140412 n=1 Tax=Syzygium oleosum TaxID=219896 RepID=UPI0024BB946F|nr:uncharacterized protein LOC130140412 [Syzygium oleosum]
MARLSACSAEEARTSLAKPSIKIPAELRHTQAIEPSKEPGCNCGSGRSLLKTRLFLAFQISQRTTETNSNSGELLLLGMYFISHSSMREVWYFEIWMLSAGPSQTSLVHLHSRNRCSVVSA